MDINELLAKITDDRGRMSTKRVDIPQRTELHQISTVRMRFENGY